MTTLTDKRVAASLHILGLILDCQKHEAETISSLSHAFNVLHHPGFDGLDDLDVADGPVPACAEAHVPVPSQANTATVGEAGPDTVTTPVVTTTATPAKKAPAKKAPAKKEAAVTEPVETEIVIEKTPAATDTGKPLTPGEAERFRALIRDTFVARTKLISQTPDPDNARRIDYTAKFTQVVRNFGAETVSNAAADDLPAILDAVRAIPL